MNTLFLALFTPLCCFIVSLTIPAASLQGLVFWKWNASYPEASLDGVHYWFGDDDCCSSCPWLPAPLRAFLLQVNNRQQKARRNSRTGSVTWLCMPGTLNIMHIRAAPIPSFSPGHCDILFDIYIFPLTMAQDTFARELHEFYSFDWHVTLAHKEGNNLPCKGDHHQISQNRDSTGTSGTSSFLLYPQAPGTASGQLAEYLQAKNIAS